MTINEAIVQLWEFDGEPSDLDPWIDAMVDYDPETELDPTSQGVTHYLRLLSQAQVSLSNWKTRGNRPVRFRDFQVATNVKLKLDDTQYTAVKLTDYSLMISAPLPYMLTNALESARCEIVQTGSDGSTTTDILMAMYIEIASDDSYIIVHFRESITSPTVAVVSTTIQFTFDRFKIVKGSPVLDSPYLLMPTRFRNILKVTDYDSSTPLTKPGRREDLMNTSLSTGAPSEWYALGKMIYFDTYFEEPRWFRIEYQKLPDELTSIDQEFEIPEQWHEVLLLIVQWQQAKRAQENEMAARYRSDIDGYISRQRLDAEEDYIRQQTGYFKLRKS